ncbi:ABC transporter ATP-binding protein [Herminiimonas arsenitoxidans]|uniref:ABC transporter ATP-binding protein n=1 Tax=Herminiimonas arsenitoxidans TaxID=1809410 RepID=UPI0009F87CE9|nr:ABC transporter ATP-binding protein [Herminiimonas arsenitoxidans]
MHVSPVHANASALAFLNITHSYGKPGQQSLQALNEINIELKAGEIVAIVGPSGCGKTTLLRLAAGLITPTGGSISVHGQPVDKPRADVSMIFQDAVMLPWFTVIENVTLPLRIRGEDMVAARAEALTLLQRVGLGDFADAFPKELSGGMRQRAAIVRALITKPKLLLMDEPFGALDALTREQMNLTLAHIAEESGATVLLITHSISEAVFLADRVIVMTARPARIADDIAVPLARPRARETLKEPVFQALIEEVRGYFYQETEHV